jgi:glyoxylase-like metal-dependent hydrolase (beta-lactamase superfamily II)
MKYALFATALLLGASQAQPALAQKPSDLVAQSVKAMGGAQALRGLKTFSASGDAKFWEPGQSEKAGGEPRFLGDATFAIKVDLAGGMARTDWDRDQKYPPPPAKLKYSEIVTPAMGAVTDAKGSKPMSGIRVAAHLRELWRAAPTLLLKAMDSKVLINGGKQALGKQSLPAVSFDAGGTNFTVLFDPKSHLPAAIRTRDDDNISGDSNFDLVLSDWKPAGDVQVARALSYRVNGIEVAHLTVKEATANPALAADTFNVPADVKSAAKAPATGAVPYQWVIRRLFLARFLDSDGIFVPPGGSLKLVELAPNVQHVQGGTANHLIINMKDGLVIVDAPYGEAQSRWTIDAAKKKYPGKPVKTLVLTHHHMDHTGGARTFMAEGAQLIVPAPDKAYFEKVARMPHTVATDELQKKPKPARVSEVKDQLALKDDTEEVRLYNIPNPHAQGMFLVYLPKENIVYVTDLISPRGPIDRNENTVAVGTALKKYGITGATIAGGHGTTAKQSDIEPALAQK